MRVVKDLHKSCCRVSIRATTGLPEGDYMSQGYHRVQYVVSIWATIRVATSNTCLDSAEPYGSLHSRLRAKCYMDVS